MEEECIQELQRVLPELDSLEFTALVQHLTAELGLTKKEDLSLVEADDLQGHLKPILCRRFIHAFKPKALDAIDQFIALSTLPNEETASAPNMDTQLTDGQANITLPPCAQPHSSRLSSTPQNSWISHFQIPWGKMPEKLVEATLGKKRARPEDRRAWKRIVVDAMLAHCPNPNKAACEEIAKVIVSKYPSTFADANEEGEQIGIGYYSLARQMKQRVEHVNRNNVSEKVRRPRSSTETTDGDGAIIKMGRSKVDSYGCINWQPKVLPEGENIESLENRRKYMADLFKSFGPTAVDRPDVDESMRLTYMYQRHMLNSCPPPSIDVIEEHWPFLFTKRGLSNHFKILTGIDVCDRAAGALQSKGKRIINFFQRKNPNRDIQRLLQELAESNTMLQSRTGIAAVLLLMKRFREQEDSIFLLADTNATKLSIETDMTLPATPRLIMLGNTVLDATKWMVSMEGKVAFVLEEHLGFADALSIFFGCFYVFNIEYQEPACATLELIQRFFMRINPEEGTKCTAKTGLSRKTGAVVKRKAEAINSNVVSFLRELTEFEWSSLD
ncbi:uncharacterized protein LOC141802203 [Halichoeres trimaculatus]|uniref:uncharacterized protein LOC141802203 n=2 Tax=Halichoeres trimaculatus TaxID=147232 RepID=UPI003D9F8213